VATASLDAINGVREATYYDADEAASAIRSTSVEFALLEAPRTPWRVGEAQLGNATLCWGRVGASSAGIGAMKCDAGWLVMTANETTRWALNRLPFGAGNIAFVPEGSEFAVRYAVPGGWFAVAFQRDWLALESGVVVPRRAMLGGQVVSFEVGERATGARYAFRTACAFTRRHPERLASARVRSMLRTALFNSLLLAIGADDEPRMRHDARTGRRLLAYLREHSSEPLYVSDVGAALGLSERTLRLIFREILGASPADFLRRRRLHLARRAMRSGQADTVTGAATEFGFFDLGRFAGAYRALFGESPSQTLRAPSFSPQRAQA
jgi:AraC-like DNA-binding protein